MPVSRLEIVKYTRDLRYGNHFRIHHMTSESTWPSHHSVRGRVQELNGRETIQDFWVREDYATWVETVDTYCEAQPRGNYKTHLKHERDRVLGVWEDVLLITIYHLFMMEILRIRFICEILDNAYCVYLLCTRSMKFWSKLLIEAVSASTHKPTSIASLKVFAVYSEKVISTILCLNLLKSTSSYHNPFSSEIQQLTLTVGIMNDVGSHAKNWQGGMHSHKKNSSNASQVLIMEHLLLL